MSWAGRRLQAAAVHGVLGDDMTAAATRSHKRAGRRRAWPDIICTAETSAGETAGLERASSKKPNTGSALARPGYSCCIGVKIVHGEPRSRGAAGHPLAVGQRAGRSANCRQAGDAGCSGQPAFKSVGGDPSGTISRARVLAHEVWRLVRRQLESPAEAHQEVTIRNSPLGRSRAGGDLTGVVEFLPAGPWRTGRRVASVGSTLRVCI